MAQSRERYRERLVDRFLHWGLVSVQIDVPSVQTIVIDDSKANRHEFEEVAL